jgi:hypothetical protein
MQLFVLMPNMLFILLANQPILMKITSQNQHFDSFGHGVTIVSYRKILYIHFKVLETIPKDGGFHELSEYIITPISIFRLWLK